MAPRAHLAMYKVVWAMDLELTFASDLLAGMEQAILDGVDIMSLSMGINQTSYFTDVVFITDLPLYYGKGNLSKVVCSQTALETKLLGR